jgi:uncharacterized protein (DUF488 family)
VTADYRNDAGRVDAYVSRRTAAAPMTVFTVGHGTLSDAAFGELLHVVGADHVVDVRSLPGSRHNPQYGREQLERWLAEAGVAYSWDRRLGGRRHSLDPSPNVALRHKAFRAYADHMAGLEFHAGLDALVELAGSASVAVMCAESLWWRCHRRLLADALVVLRSVPVAHLFHDGRLAVHTPTPEVRRVEDRLVYDLGDTTALR